MLKSDSAGCRPTRRPSPKEMAGSTPQYQMPLKDPGLLRYPDQPLEMAGWPTRRRFNAATGPSINP